MVRTVVIYGVVLAGAALLLEWLQARLAMRLIEPSVYAVGLALVFTAIGVWAGTKLTPRQQSGPFRPNEKAVLSLGISPREREVLQHLAAGHSNKEIARLMDLSPNTVKTHLGSVFGKLEATRRTQAVQKARSLQILP